MLKMIGLSAIVYSACICFRGTAMNTCMERVLGDTGVICRVNNRTLLRVHVLFSGGKIAYSYFPLIKAKCTLFGTKP